MPPTLPASFNLPAVAHAIIDGPSLIGFEGDSTYSTNDDRTVEGIIKHWRVNTVAGWVTIGGEQLWDVGLNGGSGVRTATARQDNWYGGSDKTVAPIGINELAWSADDTQGVHRITLNNTLRQWFPGGDPFSNVALNADFAYFADSTSVEELRFRGRRSDDSQINNFDNVDTSSDVVDGEVKRFEVAVPAAANTGSNLPSMDILCATGYNESGKKWWPLACRFYRPNIKGTAFCFLGSRAGWTASDHFSNNPVSGRCSDARRRAYYTAIGKPNVFWLCLGQNNGDYVSIAQYSGVLESVIANRRAVCGAVGVTPLFVLEAPYHSTNTNANGSNFAAAMYNVSQKYSDVAFINTWELAINLVNATGFSLSGDNLHQSATGATYYPAISWALLQQAYFGTHAKRLRNRWQR